MRLTYPTGAYHPLGCWAEPPTRRPFATRASQARAVPKRAATRKGPRANAPAKLGLHGLGLAVAFGGAPGVGTVVDPLLSVADRRESARAVRGIGPLTHPVPGQTGRPPHTPQHQG